MRLHVQVHSYLKPPQEKYSGKRQLRNVIYVHNIKVIFTHAIILKQSYETSRGRSVSNQIINNSISTASCQCIDGDSCRVEGS